MRETAKTDLYLRVLPLEVCYRNKNIYGIGEKREIQKYKKIRLLFSAIICDELSFISLVSLPQPLSKLNLAPAVAIILQV